MPQEGPVTAPKTDTHWLWDTVRHGTAATIWLLKDHPTYAVEEDTKPHYCLGCPRVCGQQVAWLPQTNTKRELGEQSSCNPELCSPSSRFVFPPAHTYGMDETVLSR